MENILNKFSFINKASKKLLQRKKEHKELTDIQLYTDVLTDMISKEKKKHEK
jgi:hypothetical protein